MIIGQVIKGSVGGKLTIRVKSEVSVDVGDILIVEEDGVKYYVKVIDSLINSLLPSQFVDDIAGQSLEHEADMRLFDRADRFYKTCEAKILKVYRSDFQPPRSLPSHFAVVKQASSQEFQFLKTFLTKNRKRNGLKRSLKMRTNVFLRKKFHQWCGGQRLFICLFRLVPLPGFTEQL